MLTSTSRGEANLVSEYHPELVPPRRHPWLQVRPGGQLYGVLFRRDMAHLLASPGPVRGPAASSGLFVTKRSVVVLRNEWK
jgi:hypothetical protein